jgi:CRP-like cAMP-binding protein
MGARLRSAYGPLAETFRNPGLRRVQLAFVGSLLGSWSYLVALSVYAYARGGARDVAVVGILRMVPAGLAAPFASTLADRLPRRLVMVSSDAIRAVVMLAAAAVIASDGPAWVVYGLVVVSSIASSPFHPAQAALLPVLARSPAELTAANAASSTLDGVATFVGPALGGFVLAATNVQTVFALNAASFVWSALLVVSIRVTEPVAERRREGHTDDHALTAGFRAIMRRRGVATLVSLYAGQTIVAGAMSVFVVVVALQLLHRGVATVGLLSGALGIGGLIGGLVAVGLSSRSRLTADFAIGLALFGAPFALIGGVSELVPALLAMGIVGIGNSIVDVSAVTLLQRAVPDEVLGRVLGVVYGMLLAAFGLGALVTPLLIDLLGVPGALIAVGAFLPALALAATPALRRVEDTTHAPAFVGLLRGVSILSALPLATLERLATSLVEVRAPAETVVIRAGERGDRFYVVGEGEVEIEGQAHGPGSSFGEIALLRDVPRTATVTARTDVLLHALERDEFLAAVTAHEPSVAAAETVITRRLGELRDELTAMPDEA